VASISASYVEDPGFKSRTGVQLRQGSRGFPLISADKLVYSTLKQTLTASYHILSISMFTYHHT